MSESAGPRHRREHDPTLVVFRDGPGRRRAQKPSRLGQLGLGAAASMGLVAVTAVVTGGSNGADATRPVADHQPTAADSLVPLPPPVFEPLDPPRAGAGARQPGQAATYLSTLDLPRDLTVSAKAIPRRVLSAYVAAARAADRSDPACDVHWYLLAGIGYIESGHAHAGGSAGPHWSGQAVPPIYGPTLDGSAGVAWSDTDHGRLDGDPHWERAVGPMQFMPTTWAVWGADGNHDHRKDPQQIDDATLAAANYLCASPGPLTRPAAEIAAVYSYNHSYTYVRDVLTVAAEYAGLPLAALGVDQVPGDPAPTPTSDPSTTPSATPTGRTARPLPRPSAAPSAPSGAGSPSPDEAPSSTATPSPSEPPPSAPSATPTSSATA